MIRYNLYYNYEKINKTPLTKDEVNRVKNVKKINKINEVTKTITEIDTSRINIVECHIL